MTKTTALAMMWSLIEQLHDEAVDAEVDGLTLEELKAVQMYIGRAIVEIHIGKLRVKYSAPKKKVAKKAGKKGRKKNVRGGRR